MRPPSPHEADRIALSVKSRNEALESTGGAAGNMRRRARGRANHAGHPPRAFGHDSRKPFGDFAMRSVTGRMSDDMTGTAGGVILEIKQRRPVAKAGTHHIAANTDLNFLMRMSGKRRGGGDAKHRRCNKQSDHRVSGKRWSEGTQQLKPCSKMSGMEPWS
jgi:hypothetical protein